MVFKKCLWAVMFVFMAFLQNHAMASTPRIFETFIEEDKNQSLIEKEIDEALLSLQIEKTGISELKQKLQNLVVLKEEGKNPFTQGEMFSFTENRLGVEALQEATFIFDSKGIMSAALLSLKKTQNETSLFPKIRQKMAQIYSEKGFSYNEKTFFNQENVKIELDGASASSLEVRFLSDEFRQQFASFMNKNKQPKKEILVQAQQQAQPEMPLIQFASDDSLILE